MRTAYIIRRTLTLIPTLLLVYSLTFVLMHATPGGPWDTGEKPIPAAVQEKLKVAYGLHKPLWQQYVDFLGRAVQGDLGPSYTQRSRSVADNIRETFPVSLQLGAVAIAIVVLVGVPLSILGAVQHNRPLRPARLGRQGSWNTSVNKVYRRACGGRRVLLSKNEDASKSEAATADAPPTTLVVDGGPSTSPPGGSGALYLG